MFIIHSVTRPYSIGNKYSLLLIIKPKNSYIHTYHSRFIPEGVAEASQTFLQNAHVLPKLFSYE
jgi:hypothetical protein